MDLYLIRHAEAAALGEGGVENDEERPLTEAGEKQLGVIAKGLKRHGIQFDLVLTSPLVRARQTADGIVGALPASAPEVQVHDALSPGGRAKKLARFLRKLNSERIALVGHQPDLGELAGWLVGSKKAQIDLAKAGVACVQCPDGPRKGSGTLVWLVTPEWLG
jgi:phosphohistidine phosphatase